MLLRTPRWDEELYWSLDLELGGLNAKKDVILAVGMVAVREGVVKLGESFASLIRAERAELVRPSSIGAVAAHQLVWGDVRDAPPVGAVLEEIDVRLRQGVLLVHQASIDVAFLQRAYKSEGRRWPRPAVVDTVALLLKAAHRSRFTSSNPEEVPSLNLSEARRDARLPEYQAHDPLMDAIATAELFLVLRRKLGARTLRDLQ